MTIKVATIIGVLAWIRSAIDVVITTPRGSPERAQKLSELSEAVTYGRALSEAYHGKLARELRAVLLLAELALTYLQPPGQTRDKPAEEGGTPVIRVVR
jgi:hypothetical protein